MDIVTGPGKVFIYSAIQTFTAFVIQLQFYNSISYSVDEAPPLIAHRGLCYSLLLRAYYTSLVGIDIGISGLSLLRLELVYSVLTLVARSRYRSSNSTSTHFPTRF